MKIVAIPATNSRAGINRRLVDHVAGRLAELEPGVEIEVLDLNEFEMPIFSTEREAGGDVVDESAVDTGAGVGGGDGDDLHGWKHPSGTQRSAIARHIATDRPGPKR